MTVQISEVVVSAEFTQHIVENSLVSTAPFQSGVDSSDGGVWVSPPAGWGAGRKLAR